MNTETVRLTLSFSVWSFVLLIAMLISFVLGCLTGGNAVRRAAIKNHVAHYEANAAGDSVFAWNTKEVEPKK